MNWQRYAMNPQRQGVVQTAGLARGIFIRSNRLRRWASACVGVIGLLLFSSMNGRVAMADQLSLMPLPTSVHQDPASFALRPDLRVKYATYHDARLEAGVNRMLRRLAYETGLAQSRPQPHTDKSLTDSGLITLDVDGPGETVQSLDEDESYSLAVTTSGIQLNARTVTGALHGMETLLQLVNCKLGPCHLPAVAIEDSPRFRWRGLMIDTGRHFEPVSVLERTLDGMALVKLNVFHWHLSDDQGFRAESRVFPRLTGMGSGGLFYTQGEMRHIVAYARARGIRVVPEFDMPGHTVSWLVGYPELGSSVAPTGLPTVFGVHDEVLDPTRESTYKFLDAFIEEMTHIFPDTYLHIGGDENNGKAWRENPEITAFMRAKGIKSTDGLQAYFNQRLLAIVTRHGKRMIGWDEVLTPGLPKDVTIQSWRGETSLAQGVRAGYAGILSAPYYLDAMKSSQDYYLADPMPANPALTKPQQALVLGGEACMWSEQLDSRTIDSRIWPRMAAIAERFWSPADQRDVDYMYQRLQTASLQLESVGLTQISGPHAALRNLASSLDPVSLQIFASVLEPVGFGERYDAQHTNATTPLDGLVDAVVPDPPSRYEIRSEVEALTKQIPSATDSRRALADRFNAWRAAIPSLTALANQSPRMPDAGIRVIQLGQLAEVGSSALNYLQKGEKPPPEWRQQQLNIIMDAEKPAAMVRFTFLPSLRELVLAAGK